MEFVPASSMGRIESISSHFGHTECPTPSRHARRRLLRRIQRVFAHRQRWRTVRCSS
jgi:hypothetical protein